MIINETDLIFFINRLKKLVVKWLNIPNIGFSNDENIRQIQITFLSAACTDTIVEYFKGNLNYSLNQIGDTIYEAINKLKNN